MEFETVKRGSLGMSRAGFSSLRPIASPPVWGGVSTGSLSSLNLGIHRGDQPERVWKNYEVLGKAVGFAPEHTVFTRQTHTDIVALVGRANRGRVCSARWSRSEMVW